MFRVKMACREGTSLPETGLWPPACFAQPLCPCLLTWNLGYSSSETLGSFTSYNFLKVLLRSLDGRSSKNCSTTHPPTHLSTSPTALLFMTVWVRLVQHRFSLAPLFSLRAKTLIACILEGPFLGLFCWPTKSVF